MRLREYIDNSFEQQDPKALLMRAIDTCKDETDIQQIVSLIASLSQDMDNDDLIFVKQYFERMWEKFQSQIRSIQ